jgi:hypothetical protein
VQARSVSKCRLLMTSTQSNHITLECVSLILRQTFSFQSWRYSPSRDLGQGLVICNLAAGISPLANFVARLIGIVFALAVETPKHASAILDGDQPS